MGYINYRAFVWLALSVLVFSCVNQDKRDPPVTLEDWGYRIVSGPGMGELAVLQHGEVVWAIDTYMVSHEPPQWKEPGLFELLVDTRETRREGTRYRLELGPDGIGAVQESPGPPSGIQLPEQPIPSFDVEPLE